MKLLIFLFISSQAFAQLSLQPDYFKPVPETSALPSGPTKWTYKSTPLPTYNEQQVNQLAQTLEQQFQKSRAALKKSPPNCANTQFAGYVQALFIKGQLDDVHRVTTTCVGKVKTLNPYLIAALSEATRYNYAQADYFFALATEPQWKTSADFTEALFQKASYSLFGNHEDQVDGILAQIPDADATEVALWKGLLQRVGEIDTAPLTKKQIDQFLQEQIQKRNGSFKGLLISLQIRIFQRDHRYDEALEILFAQASLMINPLTWYGIAYDTLYYGLDQNFRLARKVYDVTNRYANPWMRFPSENNTYDYTEIYGDVCGQNLIQPSTGADFIDLKKQLRSGEVAFSEALEKLNQMKPRYSGKADFLAAYAGLLAMQGQHQEAFQLYWQSRQICPYYNRANWGLTLEKRFFQYANRPDYEKLNQKIDRELQGRVIPEAIATYIVNWKSLNADVQKRVAFGSRIWLPYMEVLQTNEMHSYIKFAFDLLSESPELADIRDARIGGDHYPHDNRLWDDVRGLGGSMVIADLSEVYQGVQGDYNLLGHEMAHQFQFLLEKIAPAKAECIVNQYAQAKAENNFPDSYSSQNKEEHFAQGVTYYLVPADSPARFGLNQNWVKTYNASQFNFVQSIDLAKGDLARIQCSPN